MNLGLLCASGKGTEIPRQARTDDWAISMSGGRVFSAEGISSRLAPGFQPRYRRGLLVLNHPFCSIECFSPGSHASQANAEKDGTSADRDDQRYPKPGGGSEQEPGLEIVRGPKDEEQRSGFGGDDSPDQQPGAEGWFLVLL